MYIISSCLFAKMPKKGVLSRDIIIEGVITYKDKLIKDYGSGNRVAYPSDVVWTDLSNYLNFTVSASALHLFVKANRGGVLSIIGLHKDEESEPKKDEELPTNDSVKRLMPNLIEATILTGKAMGEVVLIPCIPLITTDMPFEFKRLQLPMRLSFAMSINKAQGQTLQVCGLNLKEPCFPQLYVACLGVGTPNHLFVYAPNGQTKNIVYPNVLD